MWCSTACPTTRSTEASGIGIVSASATRPSTSSPRFAALRVATSTMPGDRSVTVPRRAMPPCMRLSRKNPVPQPSSRAWSNGPAPPATARNRSTANVVQRSSNEIDHFSS